MESQTNEKIKDVFQSALERTTPAERTTYLDEACSNDPALRRRVDALLHAHETPDPLLDHTAVELLDAQGDDDGGINEWLDLLAPPSKPGSLGRIGHYEVLEVAGRGGMGVVFRAFDDKLHRVVAMKLLAPALAASKRARQQFVREARAAAAVTHENVIPIYAVEEADGPVPYLVMQFVEGISLQQKIERTGPLPLNAILRIALHIAEGLAAAHRQGLVHRDVKPANILLENGVERVKITDFGLARAGGDAVMTHSGLLTGTPSYMSPEQALGEAVDARSDLFSLGSVLHAMCTGKPPFGATSALAVLKRVCEETPQPVRQVNADLPAWLEQLIARLHAKNPADRPASAREVADVLARRLSELQDGGTSREVAAHPHAPAAGRRPRRALAAAASTLVVLLLVLGLTEATGVTRIRAAWRRSAGGAAGPVGSKDRGPVPDPAAAARAAAAEWERRVAPLSPDEQAQAVATRLKELNLGFDGVIKHQVTDGAVTQVEFSSEYVSDLSPLRALPNLKNLNCNGPQPNRGVVADLGPLRGMRLEALSCSNTPVSDLSPLKGMPLTLLECQNTLVADLTPLEEMPLSHLMVSNTRVSDLSPLRGMRLRLLNAEGLKLSDVSVVRGMPLDRLGLFRTPVSDLSPLKGMQLQYLNITAAPVTDLSPLKEMTSLRHLVLDDIAISDLSIVKNLPLDFLQISRTGVSDLSPLEGMPLRRISIDYQAPRDYRVLRSLPRLEIINDVPAADFWRAQGK
jgi:serine/threonine protein kinase/Leucine-rich repeat (LRR) protein